jgi:hypothetical protein
MMKKFFDHRTKVARNGVSIAGEVDDVRTRGPGQSSLLAPYTSGDR